MNNSQNWWYELNGEIKGPVTEQEIIAQINAGTTTRNNLVWQNGFADWKKVEDTNFENFLQNSTPPALSGSAVDNSIVWVLAFAPLLGQVIQGLLLGIFFPKPEVDFNDSNSMNNYLHYLTGTDFQKFWFITFALNIWLCTMDRKKLVSAGVDTAKMGSSWLVPVYLYKRAEILKQSPAYFWVWLILFILILI